MKNKIIQTVCLLLPAGVVGLACAWGLGTHPVDLIAPSESAVVRQESGAEETSIISQTASPEDVSEAKVSETEENQSAVKNRSRLNSKPESQKTISKTDQKQTGDRRESKSESASLTSKQASAPKKESSTKQENRSEASHLQPGTAQTDLREQTSSPNDHVSPEVSRRTENSHTAVRETSPAQTDARSNQEQSTAPQESPHQESSPSSAASRRESSVPASARSEASAEPSPVPETPTGRYRDGTYRAVAEVDGMEEEGFLYDLEVTVTVSGGEITAISGRIKNDRSEDPSSNEAYVKRAVKRLSDTIIARQEAVGVDVISNATYSSNAVLKATADALTQAER